ncbi:pyroglutamyl-peptidase 1 [Hetaerina americana]|uniref:pyroglutamyl-peptidase 1 n=1 Tax=Hetaerina americana TaxID=62018 RepID=UPI003A7F4A63
MQNNVGDGNVHSNAVIVTGFGPFKHHIINASWEAVKLLPTLKLEENLGIKLIIEKIPVSYDAVIDIVPTLWKTHNPLLFVHVGVSSIAKDITLETKANRSGYWKPDVDGNSPKSGCCPCGKDECISSSLDVEQICSEVNKCERGTLACVSSDAGRYLCEFTYYTSLSFDKDRTIFIHVPELDKPHTATELAEGIARVIKSMIARVTKEKCFETISL